MYLFVLKLHMHPLKNNMVHLKINMVNQKITQLIRNISSKPPIVTTVDEVILAYQQNGEALTTETGGPLRLVHLDENSWDENPKLMVSMIKAMFIYKLYRILMFLIGIYLVNSKRSPENKCAQGESESFCE